MTFLEQALELKPQIIAWRRDIHMNPELGFRENRTANLVVNTLREMGIEATPGVGRTGVVARIGNGNGPSIGIRADMDALPIDEANDVPYKSQTPGVMHACGHDAHTAILLGVARMLNETQLPDGEIRLLFQPSEEDWGPDGVSGAPAMINDKALEGLDGVIALHVDSTAPDGQVEISSGYVMAAVDDFTAEILGEGCHGARPQSGVDPIWIQAQVINAIQAIRSRRTDPLSASVITVGAIHGGKAANVIPDRVTLVGTIRSYDENIRQQLHSELEAAVAVSRAFGGDYTLKIRQGYPATYNHPEVAALIRTVATDLIGAERTASRPPSMGAEDFAYMTQLAPGAMFNLGTKKDKVHRPHHSPIFDISEESLHIGAAVLAETAIRMLRDKA